MISPCAAASQWAPVSSTQSCIHAIQFSLRAVRRRIPSDECLAQVNERDAPGKMLHQEYVTGDVASWLSSGAQASEASDAERNRDRISELVCSRATSWNKITGGCVASWSTEGITDAPWRIAK